MPQAFLSPKENSYSSSNQGDRYKNINLNQNHKSQKLIPVSSINVPFKDKKKLGYDNDNEILQRKSSSGSSWKRGEKDMSTTFNNNFYGPDKDDKRNRRKNDENNKSTLSLAIEFFENCGIDSDLADLDRPTKSSKSTTAKSSSNYGLFNGLCAVIKTPFEFCRQQNDSLTEPEITQYRASQHLLDPNNPPANISVANDQSSLEENATVAQNVQEAAIPTLFEYVAGKFLRRNDGSNEELTFVFGDDVVFEGDGDLDPIRLEFEGDQLFACFVDANAPDELVRGLKLSTTLEVFTDTSTQGPYNQIIHLLNRSNNEKIDSPNHEDLYNFLINYRNVNEEGKNGAPKVPKVSRKDRVTKPHGIKNSEFQKQRLTNIKSQLVGLAATLPEPETMSLAVDSLHFDLCIRNLSELGANAILDEMIKGTWKPENNIPLAVNRINGRCHVFKGKKRLQAMKKYRESNADPKHEYVKCHVYDGLNFSQKVLIARPTTVLQGTSTILQKLKLLREAVDTLGITLPKGKVLEAKYSEIMDLLFHNDYPAVLTPLIELPPAYLDQLCGLKCGKIPLEEFRLESSFWNIFVGSYKKNPSEALKSLQMLESKTTKEVEKILKKVPLDLLFFLSERGPHTYESEDAAILFFTDDPHCTKNELMKKWTAAKIDKNKSRELGRYDWDVVKAKIDALSTDDLVFPNAEYFDKITATLIGEQDFIIVQNPTKPQLELIQSSGKKALIMLMGNCGDPAPELPNVSPTATIKIVMENPFLIDKVVTSLPDPVANVSIYLPGAPAGDQVQKTRFLCSIAMERGCSLATTMTLENCHEIANLAETKTKAAFCFVTEKVARHFMSKCSDYEEISVVGEAGLREIVRSVITPPPKKRKTNDSEVDNTATE